jgi:hypothetical protein
MSMNKFQATHAIDIRWSNGKRRVIHVMLHDDGAAYTRAEWDADAAADWQVADGEWRFQGSIPACESYAVTPFARRACQHPADAMSTDALLTECPDCGAQCSGTSIGDDQLCYDDECPLHARAGVLS